LSKIGFPFYELSTVDSTNNYAMARVHEGLAFHGMAVFAHEQTTGKGQRGKSWVAEPGSNIILSVVAETLTIPHLPPFALSAAVALACHAFFSNYALDETAIKWPNDIYWRDRKAGGILIENVYRGKEWQWAVIGTGININQTRFPDMSEAVTAAGGSAGRRPPPVSLRQITGKDFETVRMAKELCGYLETEWQQLILGDTASLMARYQQRLFGLGKRVRLRKGSEILETEIRGVDGEGRLKTGPDGDSLFSVGDVEWMFDH
jgi:BirA family biotin operon repressor/biotin-[acetyl-CoA-carboxylase] ligase